jgi:translation initiation factor IF-3
LAGGFANLSDRVQVIDRDGADLGVMIVAEAQRRASAQGCELFVVEHDADPPVVRIVLVKKAPMRPGPGGS